MDVGQPIFHKKIIGDENMIPEKAFWEMIFGVEDVFTAVWVFENIFYDGYNYEGLRQRR